MGLAQARQIVQGRDATGTPRGDVVQIAATCGCTAPRVCARAVAGAHQIRHGGRGPIAAAAHIDDGIGQGVGDDSSPGAARGQGAGDDRWHGRAAPTRRQSRRLVMAMVFVAPVMLMMLMMFRMFMASVATVDGSDPTGSAWNGLGRDCMILLSCCGWAGVGIVEDVGEAVQGNGDVDLRHQSGWQWHEVGSRRRPRWAGRSDEVAQSSEHPLQRDAVGHQALGPGGRLRGAGDVADGTVLGDGAARGARVRRARWSTGVRGRRDGGGSGREIGLSAPAGLLLTGAQGAQAHGDQGIGAQLRGGAPVAGGSRGGGYGAESGIQQERVHGGQEHRHLVHALSRGTWPGDAALRRVAEAAPAGPVGVLDGQGAVDVAGELRMGTARGSTCACTALAGLAASRRPAIRAVLASSIRPARCSRSVGARVLVARARPRSRTFCARTREIPRRQAISLEVVNLFSSALTTCEPSFTGPR